MTDQPSITGIDDASERPTLLCVDDETNILNALRRLLRGRGYNVLTAASGREGLEILATTDVDLVISDMRMPEMDGARFLEQVKMRSPETVRILLTGHSDLGSTVTAINKGECGDSCQRTCPMRFLRDLSFRWRVARTPMARGAENSLPGVASIRSLCVICG